MNKSKLIIDLDKSNDISKKETISSFNLYNDIIYKKILIDNENILFYQIVKKDSKKVKTKKLSTEDFQSIVLQKFEQIDKFQEVVLNKFEQIDKFQEMVLKKFEQIDKFHEIVLKKFEEIDKFHEIVLKKFEEIDNRLTRLENRINSLEEYSKSKFEMLESFHQKDIENYKKQSNIID
ncbi:hypothetical protein [Metamycoplasma buccale]|uniref:hypothetical protein n=1 Tax=Metamycoplasma buccale TaxID=55602 RepID=UPI00398E3F35